MSRGADLSGDGNGTFGIGINNRGVIVGYYVDATPAQIHHGFIWFQGTFTVVDVPLTTFPGVTGTELYDINDHGDVVVAYIANGHHYDFIGQRQGGGNAPDAAN